MHTYLQIIMFLKNRNWEYDLLSMCKTWVQLPYKREREKYEK